MRVPQNIPLCNTIYYTGLESFTGDDNPIVKGHDNEVPIYVEVDAKNSSTDSVSGCIVHADSSYGNYKPPLSYIIPKGYKATMRYLEGSYYESYTSDGLGFVYIFGRLNKDDVEGLLVIDIVKE